MGISNSEKNNAGTGESTKIIRIICLIICLNCFTDQYYYFSRDTFGSHEDVRTVSGAT